MGIKIRKRTSSVRDIEIKNMQKALGHVRLVIASMRRSHRTRPSERRRPHELRTSESIEEFLKEALE